MRLTGLEQVRRFRHGQLPHEPLWYLTGLDITESAVGSTTFRLPVTGWLANPAGIIPGGVLAFAADSALSTAVQTAQGPRRLAATWDFALDYVQPPDARADAVLVTARLIHAGRRQALSEATLADTGGHLLAHATSWCVLMDIPGELPEPPAAPVAAPDYAGPHPFQRPAVGRPVPQDIWNTATGLQVLRAAQRGRREYCHGPRMRHGAGQRWRTAAGRRLSWRHGSARAPERASAEALDVTLLTGDGRLARAPGPRCRVEMLRPASLLQLLRASYHAADRAECCRFGQHPGDATWSVRSRQLRQTRMKADGKLVTERNMSHRAPARIPAVRRGLADGGF